MDRIKIVQINTVYGTGSTGRIMSSIDELASTAGYETYVAYGRGKKPSKPNQYRIGNKADFLVHVLYNFCGFNGCGSKFVTRRFLKWLDSIHPDIIHLHNIHGFYINYEMLFQYIKENNIPVVWTFHDCWPFTGHCAYFDFARCNKWRIECEHCPIFRSDYPYSVLRDNSKSSYRRKKEAFSDVDSLSIITPSKWLADLARQSFLGDYNIEVINNGVNQNYFFPCAEMSTSPRIILAVANVWEKRKGLEYIYQLSSDFNQTNGYRIAVIGLSKRQRKQCLKKFNIDDVLPICRTNSQAELAKWYSRAYVYVNTSLQENFPTTNIEALSCGTPIVTFNTGGSPESIGKHTGIVVEKGNYEMLKQAILHLDDIGKINRNECAEQAKRYDANRCLSKYLEVYQRIESNRESRK